MAQATLIFTNVQLWKGFDTSAPDKRSVQTPNFKTLNSPLFFKNQPHSSKLVVRVTKPNLYLVNFSDNFRLLFPTFDSLFPRSQTQTRLCLSEKKYIFASIVSRRWLKQAGSSNICFQISNLCQSLKYYKYYFKPAFATSWRWLK